MGKWLDCFFVDLWLIKHYKMAKKKTSKNEFIKWFGPILDALRDLGGSAKPREIAQWIGDKHKLSEQILNARYEKSGVLRFHNQLAWGRQYLIWEDLLETSSHGVWTLSKKGWKAILNEETAHEIVSKWIKYFQDIKDGKTPDKIETKTRQIDEIEDEIDGGTLENIRPSLIDILQNISPTGFEHLCGRLLREYDFENIQISQRSHDGGIDGYATLKLNPFVNMSVYFQCKRYKDSVPTEKVQAFIGVMETNKRSVEKGIFITTGSFAKAAYDIEKNNIKLELIDGEKLVEMFEKVKLGVTPKTIYEPDIDFFEQYREMK